MRTRYDHHTQAKKQTLSQQVQTKASTVAAAAGTFIFNTLKSPAADKN